MFKGTSSKQDFKFSDKQKKSIEATKFPVIFNNQVTMSKVNLDVLKPFITRRIYNYIGIEDEVVPEFVFSLLGNSENPDPKDIFIQLTGFLEDNTKAFMKDLWKLLLSAQESEAGIPKQLVEEVKKELEAKRIAKEEEDGRVKRTVEERERKRLSERNVSRERYRDDRRRRDRSPYHNREYSRQDNYRDREDNRVRDRERDFSGRRHRSPSPDQRRHQERSRERHYERRESYQRRSRYERSRSNRRKYDRDPSRSPRRQSSPYAESRPDQQKQDRGDDANNGDEDKTPVYD